MSNTYYLSDRDFIIDLKDRHAIIPQVRFNRLEKLLDILADVKAKQFDIHVWANNDEPSCGTTACAAGWAASSPVFRKVGLGLQARPFDDLQKFEIVFNPKRARDIRVAEVRFDGEPLTGIYACEAFFGLTHDEAFFLFAPSEYTELVPSRRRVMKRIRRFIKEARKDRLKVAERDLESCLSW